MPIDAVEFRRALGQFASGVTIVTTRDAEGRPLGLTVSAFCSLSLEPPLVLVCVDLRSEANAGFRASSRFAVSILAEGQQELSQRFAFGGPDKFAGPGLTTSARGLVLVAGALAHLECRVTAAHECGDHVIYAGEVEQLSTRPGRPLLYHAGTYGALGSEPGDGA